ncbi:MAG: DUF554 family protein [Verrucomicrobiota bacterium]
MLGSWINAMTVAGALLGARCGVPVPSTATGISRLRWGVAGLSVALGGSGIARALPSPGDGTLRFLAIAGAGLVLGNLTGRALGLQRRLDAWGKGVTTPRPEDCAKSTETRNALSLGLLLALNPLLIPAAIQEGLEGRWQALALKSILDGAALLSWCRGFATDPSPGLVARVTIPVAAWQALWTAGAAAAASGFLAGGSAAPLMLATDLLLLCSAPTIAGLRKVPHANLLPTLLWVPLLTTWFRR